MRSKEGLSISGVTLTADGIQKDSGKFETPSAIECIEDGALLITWKDGSNGTYLFEKGMRNTIICKSVEITAGKFNISWVD